MEKKYQVFISSTFRDLIAERQAVLKAVLELGHMPAGMELFPAADESAWELICDVIDASDYYVLIIGGRYGSLDDAGLGYTEKEYDYAVQKKIPVVPLLHKNPDNLPREKTETEEAAWKKLKLFRAKVEKKHTCVYWESPEDLKVQVILGITTSVKRHPAVGWARANQIPTGATVTEVLTLRNRIAELEAQVERDRLSPPKGTDELEQGEDQFNISCNFRARFGVADYSGTSYDAHITLSWNQIFGAIAPTMINEASKTDVYNTFRDIMVARFKSEFSKDKKFKGAKLDSFKFSDEVIETCIIQLRALGLIKESVRTRSVKDTDTYWCLTPYGDFLMTQLRAIRRIQDEATNAIEDVVEEKEV